MAHFSWVNVLLCSLASLNASHIPVNCALCDPSDTCVIPSWCDDNHETPPRLMTLWEWWVVSPLGFCYSRHVSINELLSFHESLPSSCCSSFSPNIEWNKKSSKENAPHRLLIPKSLSVLLKSQQFQKPEVFLFHATNTLWKANPLRCLRQSFANSFKWLCVTDMEIAALD